MNGLAIGYEKKMRRYWIDSEQLTQNSGNPELVFFEGEQFHHIFDVCRQEVGSRFEVLHPQRKAYLVEVIEVKKKNATAKVIESRDVPALPYPHIHLALSLPRFPVFDSVLEKMVEMGVSGIQPFFSEFSFIRDPKNFSNDKISRWKKIVTSATQQSGRGELMDVQVPISWSQLNSKINQSSNKLCLFSYEGESTLGVKDFIKSEIQKMGSIHNIWLIVGSEGGFSSSEVEYMKTQGFHPVTLGSQVLRVETACMTLVSVLKYEFDLMR